MSTFQSTLLFFDKLGIYDVVLPFLLVFTLVFAILEKSKIFGFEPSPDGDGQRTRKNLNAMVAFVTGFLVVASAEIVRIINTVIADAVLLLLMSVLFLMLAGSFHKDKEFSLEGPWKNIFMVIMFVGIVLIFLNALGWLQVAWGYMLTNLQGPIVGSVFMLIIVIAAIYGIVGGGGSTKSE